VHEVLKVAFPKSDKSTGFGKLFKKKLMRDKHNKKSGWSFMQKSGTSDLGNVDDKDSSSKSNVKGRKSLDLKTGGAGMSAKPQRRHSHVKLVPLEMDLEQSGIEIDNENEFSTTAASANTTANAASSYAGGTQSRPIGNGKSKPLRRGSARFGATVSFGDALVDFGDDDDDEETGRSKPTRALPSVAALPAAVPTGGKSGRVDGVASHLPGQALQQQLGDEEEDEEEVDDDDDDEEEDDDAFIREYAADLVEDTSLPMGQKLLELAGLREKGDLSARDFAAAKAYLLKVTADGQKHDGGVDRILNDANLTFTAKLEKLAVLREERKVTPQDFAKAKATLLQRERTKPRTKELAYLNDIIEDPELSVMYTHLYCKRSLLLAASLY